MDGRSDKDAKSVCGVQVKDIKLAANKGDQVTVKTLAKSLVRLRQQIGKLTASEAAIRGVSTNLTVRSVDLESWLYSKHLPLHVDI